MNQKLKKNKISFTPFFALFEINGPEFLANSSLSMKNLAAKFGRMVILGILKRLDGLDFAHGAHKISEIIIQLFGFFYNYVKIYEESTTDIWSRSSVWPF